MKGNRKVSARKSAGTKKRKTRGTGPERVAKILGGAHRVEVIKTTGKGSNSNQRT